MHGTGKVDYVLNRTVVLPVEHARTGQIRVRLRSSSQLPSSPHFVRFTFHQRFRDDEIHFPCLAAVCGEGLLKMT
jgi:hypothetical protein